MVQRVTLGSQLVLVQLDAAGVVQAETGAAFGTAMRAVAGVQTDIQTKLKRGMDIIKKWKQVCDIGVSLPPSLSVFSACLPACLCLPCLPACLLTNVM